MSYVQVEESIGFGCHPQHGPMVLRQLKLENSNLPTWQIFSPVNPWAKYRNLPFIVYWQRVGWQFSPLFWRRKQSATCGHSPRLITVTFVVFGYCWGWMYASLLMCKNHIKGVKGILHTYIYIYIYVVYINIYQDIYIYNISYIRSTSTGGNFFHQQYTQVMQQKIGRLQPPLREAMRPRSVPRSMGAYAPARGW